jgi:hypothetical protein
LFSAPQCLGYRNELGIASQDMCFPPHDLIAKQVKLAVKEYHAKSVFVSSDNDHLIPFLTKALKRMEVSLLSFFKTKQSFNESIENILKNLGYCAEISKSRTSR